MRNRPVDNFLLEKWRMLDAALVLQVLADHVKQDAEYEPRTSLGSTRWHALVNGHDHELLCTGAKFFDTRTGKGGGGAVDLVMHLYQIDFKKATSLLAKRGM